VRCGASASAHDIFVADSVVGAGVYMNHVVVIASRLFAAKEREDQKCERCNPWSTRWH
jgi:hypothetical protein